MKSSTDESLSDRSALSEASDSEGDEGTYYKLFIIFLYMYDLMSSYVYLAIDFNFICAERLDG